VKIRLTIISGPDLGREFIFEGHDTFLVGRTPDSHFRISDEVAYFSRRHFLLEFNPPRCRLIDLESRNGTLLNGVRVTSTDVRDGDEIGVGTTVFKVAFLASEAGDAETAELSPPAIVSDNTVDYLLFPTTFPGYRIMGELGRGGMGVVYRATSERDGSPVALKSIVPSGAAGRKQIERFLRECQILDQLRHPNIVEFREVGEAADIIFLAMELVDGPDLGVWLREKGPLDVPTAIRIACQFLGGLAQAHAQGFVHRDVKPGNILLGRSGDKRIAKLADFGIARVYETSKISGLTLQGDIGGTPAYMAPEQVTHYRLVLPAADQYSAAATLYRMLTDCYIHDLPRDLGAQISQILTAEPISIRKRRPDIPIGLAEVIHKALHRDPAERYPDVLAFRKELKPFA